MLVCTFPEIQATRTRTRTSTPTFRCKHRPGSLIRRRIWTGLPVDRWRRRQNWSGRDVPRWSFPEYDRLWEQAATELGAVKRATLYMAMNVMSLRMMLWCD